MRLLKELLDNNRRWADEIKEQHPDFFSQLTQQQSPDYVWIGCSDSRVAANQIVDLIPGEIFVHRNFANVVVHTDLNCLSVIQFAVEVLQVKHIIVCGHYGCGGIKSAMDSKEHGLIDNWLRHIKDVCHTTIVQKTWKSGNNLAVHGWVYGIEDGILKDLGVCTNSLDQSSSTHFLR